MIHTVDAHGVPAPGPDVVHRLVKQLAREFEAPLGLLDPAGPVWRIRMGTRIEAFPAAEDSLAAVRESRVLELGQVMLWRPEPETGPVWLGLPAALPWGEMLVAMIGFSARSSTESSAGWGHACPDRALRAWGQTVANRICDQGKAQTEQDAGARGSDERALALFDRLTRRLTVSDPPEEFQLIAASALRDAIKVEAVAWVPSRHQEPTVVAGGVSGVGMEVYRSLLPEGKVDLNWINNDPIGPHRSVLKRIAVVADEAKAPAGWFLAVNPEFDNPFTADVIGLLQTVASLVATQRANARLYKDLKQLFFGVIRALTSAIDAKDPYTSGHSERVARIAVRLGEELGMSINQRGDLYLIGLLHDIGKIGIDDGVLRKSGPLTNEEILLIQSHVRIGIQILSDLKKMHHLLPGVLHHHERIDGTGYPSGLAGDAIPIEARILAVADAFDAMSSTRPYRRRLSPGRVDEIFHKGSGTQWDKHVLAALFACRPELDRVRQKGLGESLNRVVDETLGRSSSVVTEKLHIKITQDKSDCE